MVLSNKEKKLRHHEINPTPEETNGIKNRVLIAYDTSLDFRAIPHFLWDDEIPRRLRSCGEFLSI